MSLNILLRRQAQKDMRSLSSKDRERVSVAIDSLRNFSPGASGIGIKKLRTPLAGYRKRVGGYRVLFRVQDEFVIISAIVPRSKAYRRKK